MELKDHQVYLKLYFEIPKPLDTLPFHYELYQVGYNIRKADHLHFSLTLICLKL
ncbi:hypothetical protein D3C85_879150 [compost metagenome]